MSTVQNILDDLKKILEAGNKWENYSNPYFYKDELTNLINVYSWEANNTDEIMQKDPCIAKAIEVPLTWSNQWDISISWSNDISVNTVIQDARNLQPVETTNLTGGQVSSGPETITPTSLAGEQWPPAVNTGASVTGENVQ